MRSCSCLPCGPATGRALTRSNHGPTPVGGRAMVRIGHLLAHRKETEALFSPADYVRNQLSSLHPHQHQLHPPLLGGTTILPVPAVDLQNRPGLVSTASLPTPPSPTWWTDSHHTADSWGAVGQIGAESPNIEHVSQSVIKFAKGHPVPQN